MKKMLLTGCAALTLVGCATYHDDYRGAPAADTDVIYVPPAGETRGPGGLDYPKGNEAPPATPPSGNRLRGLEPLPSNPTEVVPR